MSVRDNLAYNSKISIPPGNEWAAAYHAEITPGTIREETRGLIRTQSNLSQVLRPQAGVWVPLKQTGVTIFLTFCAVGSAGWYWSWDRPFPLAVMVSTFAGLGFWIIAQINWRDMAGNVSGAYRIQAARANELTSPGAAQAAVMAQTVPTIPMQVERGADYVTDLSITWGQLYQFSDEVIGGEAPLGVHHWTGNGRPFTRPEYEVFRQRAKKNNLMIQINPGADNSPWKLTGQGKAFFGYWKRVADDARASGKPLPTYSATGGSHFVKRVSR